MYKIRNKFRLALAPENCTILLSYICFVLGLLCVPISAFIMLYNFPEDMATKSYGNQLLSVFIGLWAVNLVGVANFLKKR
jgi:hypothetical protein